MKYVFLLLMQVAKKNCMLNKICNMGRGVRNQTVFFCRQAHVVSFFVCLSFFMYHETEI